MHVSLLPHQGHLVPQRFHAKHGPHRAPSGSHAADIEIRTILQPLVDLGCVLFHAILHINLFSFCPRGWQGRAESVHRPLDNPAIPSDKGSPSGNAGRRNQPIFTFSIYRGTLLNKRTEGAAGAGPTIIIGVLGCRRLKVLVRRHEYICLFAGLEKIRQIGRADTFASASMAFVAHNANRQMYFVFMSLRLKQWNKDGAVITQNAD